MKTIFDFHHGSMFVVESSSGLDFIRPLPATTGAGKMDLDVIEFRRDDVGLLFNALGKYLGGEEAIVEMIDPVERMRIFGEIHTERQAQDARWGGAEHDDTHTPFEWTGFIGKQSLSIVGPPCKANRARFVKIAALAVAAIESMDRDLRLIDSDVARLAQERRSKS